MNKIPLTDIYHGVRAYIKASNLSETGPRSTDPQKLVSQEAKDSAPHSVKNEAHQASNSQSHVS